ncbi:MAG: SRPBCC family protein [Actinobacteria bacterium]|nr:SRPBCC family protein [Actinomycetota bacterium]
MRFRQVFGISAIGGVAVVGLLAVRRWQLRWGATGQEVGGCLPGDDIIGNPDLTATRAITIGTPTGQVWPWIVQLGQGRGGFYSYDFLENLVGCDIHSANRIMPAWQDVGPGDQIRLAPQVALAVAMVEPGQSLVLRSGEPTGNTSPPYDFTWAFVLKDAPGGATRLLVRERYAFLRPWARVLVEPVEAVSFVMSQKMLRGIRDRAERSAPASERSAPLSPRR